MDEDIAERLRELYGIEHSHLLSRLGGLSTINLKVELDARVFVLKQFRSTNEEDVVRFEEVADLLNANALPVALPIVDRWRARHFELDGRYHALFPFVEGMTLHEPSLTEASLSSAAVHLARLHRIEVPAGLRLARRRDRPGLAVPAPERAASVLERARTSPLPEPVLDLLRRVIEAKVALLAAGPRASLKASTAEHLVHGDFHNENILFDSTGNVVAILDFEETHLGHRARDVFTFVNFACCNTGFSDDNLTKAKYFLESYDSSHLLTEREIEAGAADLVRDICGRFFLEEELLRTGHAELIGYLERDLRKIDYFERHAGDLTTALLSIKRGHA